MTPIMFLFFVDGRIFGLDVDWITGNVYGSTLDGKVLVCSTTIPGTFPCAVVLSGLTNLERIALDPNAGWVLKLLSLSPSDHFHRIVPGRLRILR